MVKFCAQIIVIGLICRLTLGSPHERFERSFGGGLLGILGGGSSRHDHGSSQVSQQVSDQQVSEVGSVYGSDGGYGQSGRDSYGSSRWEQEGASGHHHHHHHHGYHGVGHEYHGHDHHDHGAEHVHESGIGRGISSGYEHTHGSGLLGGILGGHRHNHHHSWDHGIGGGHGHTHHGGRGHTHGNWYHGMSHGHGSGHYEGGHGHAHGGENLGHGGSVQEGVSVVERGQEGTDLGTGDNRGVGQVPEGVRTYTHTVRYHGVNQDGSPVGQVPEGVRTYTHTVHYHGVNQDGSPDDKNNVQGQVHESGGQVQEHSEYGSTGISGIEHGQEPGELDTTYDQNAQQVQQGVRTYTHTVHYQGVTQEGGSPYDKDKVQGQVHGSGSQVLVQEHSESEPTGISGIEHGQEPGKLDTTYDQNAQQVQQGVRTYTHTVHYQGVTQEGGSPNDKDSVRGQVHGSGSQVLVKEHSESEPTGISGIEHDQEGGELDTVDDQDVQQVQQGVRTYTHTVHYQGVTQEGGSPYDKDNVQEQVHDSEGQVLVGDKSVSKPTSINGVQPDGESDDFETGSGQELSQVQQGVRTYVHREYQGVTHEDDSPHDKEITQEQVDESEGQVIVQDNSDTESTNINGLDHDHESDKLTTGDDQDQDASQVQHGVRTHIHRVSYHRVTQDGSSHDKDDVQGEVHENDGQVVDQEHGESEPTRINEVEDNDHDDLEHLGSDGQELVPEQDELELTLVDETKPDHEVGKLGEKETSKYESTYETQYEENDRDWPVGSSALEPDGSSSKPQKVSEIQPKQEIGKPIQPVDHENVHDDSDVDQQSISEVNPIDESDDNIPHDGTEQRPVQDDREGDEGVGSTDGSSTLPYGGTGKPINIQEIGDSQQDNDEPSQKPINEDNINQDTETEANSGLEHFPDSNQDQQSVSSDAWIYEESREPGNVQESDALNQKVTKVESVHENKGSDESSPDESTEIGHPQDSGEENPHKISSNEQVFESYHPSGSGPKPVQGTTGSSTTTRHTVTTIEYVRNNDKPGYGGSRVVEEVYGNDKYSPGGESIGQDGLNQVSDNGEITQKEVTTTYSQQVSQGGRQVGNPNLDNIQSGSSSGYGGVVHEVVETVVGHIGGHAQAVQGVTRQGSNVLENVGLGQVQRGSGLGHTGVIQEIVSSHGGGVLGNVGMDQQQGGSASGHLGVVQEVISSHGGILGNAGLGQSQGGIGSGHMQVVQEVTRHGSTVLENVGLGGQSRGIGGLSQGGVGGLGQSGIGGLGQSGIGGLGHGGIGGLGHGGIGGLGHGGIGGLGHGGIGRITSHGTGILQQVGLGHSYGSRSDGQGYEGGSQSSSSYRTSGGSYGTYRSHSGSSGGGLAGGLLGLG